MLLYSSLADTRCLERHYINKCVLTCSRGIAMYNILDTDQIAYGKFPSRFKF